MVEKLTYLDLMVSIVGQHTNIIKSRPRCKISLQISLLCLLMVRVFCYWAGFSSRVFSELTARRMVTPVQILKGILMIWQCLQPSLTAQLWLSYLPRCYSVKRNARWDMPGPPPSHLNRCPFRMTFFENFWYQFLQNTAQISRRTKNGTIRCKSPDHCDSEYVQLVNQFKMAESWINLQGWMWDRIALSALLLCRNFSQ